MTNHDAAPHRPAPPDRPPIGHVRAISSTELLAGHTELQIEHDGQVYRLRLTRAGKLILTK